MSERAHPDLKKSYARPAALLALVLFGFAYLIEHILEQILITGKIYLGAMTSAALVSWMFASSQVIAPIPI